MHDEINYQRGNSNDHVSVNHVTYPHQLATIERDITRRGERERERERDIEREGGEREMGCN